MDFVEICNVCTRKVTIKAAMRIYNSDKICRSYCDFHFGVTFLEHNVFQRQFPCFRGQTFQQCQHPGAVVFSYTGNTNILTSCTFLSQSVNISHNANCLQGHAGNRCRTSRIDICANRHQETWSMLELPAISAMCDLRIIVSSLCVASTERKPPCTSV